MFTGIVEARGVLLSRGATASGSRLVLRTLPPLGPFRLGESIAVDGCCHTVVGHSGNDTFEVDLGPETLAATTLGSADVGDEVNLERALALGDRLGGHLVTGHVDGVGHLLTRESVGDAVLMRFAAPATVHRYLVPKGSIAVTGVSLTINRVTPDGFEVGLIPHTLTATTLGARQPGDAVNLEADLIGKYVERMVAPWRTST